MMTIPEAIVAKKAGGALEVVDFRPGSSDRTNAFYFFMVMVSGKGMMTTLLNNGVIGYFAVSKKTARVVDAVAGTENESIKGKLLEQAQSKLRARHCITPAMILKYRNVSPEN